MNYYANKENGLINEKLLKYSADFSAIRDSTQAVYNVINNLCTDLRKLSDMNSSIDEFLISSGKAENVKTVINKYCKFMSQPGFKVWNIAKDARDISAAPEDPKALVPFSNFYFEGSTALEAEIMLRNLLHEILNVEKRYYIFQLTRKSCS